ncbi:hypothetical protein FM036_34345 [Nostoc sp. HG1]|nr:hypothetical protein [Nostoc sp. HG1]
MDASLGLMSLVGLIAIVAAITSLVCLVLVLIKLFPDKGVGWGIFGIFCGIYTFIWGWQNAEEHNLKNVMIVWTAAFAANVLVRILAVSAR